MAAIHLSYLNEKGATWFNPSIGIVGFWSEFRKLKERLGGEHDVAWKHRDLKRAKEIYAISVIAKSNAMFQMPQTDWWIMKPKTDPPDGVIGTIFKKDGISKMHVREVEVVEHFTGDILDTIRKKLTRKRYEPNTVLVCLLSAPTGLYQLEVLSSEISKEVTSLDHIFLVFHGMLASELPTKVESKEEILTLAKISVVQLKPIYGVTTIDLPEVYKSRASGKEPDFFVFEGLGKGDMRPYSPAVPPKLF